MQAKHLGSWTDGKGNWLHGRMLGDEVMVTGTYDSGAIEIESLIKEGWVK